MGISVSRPGGRGLIERRDGARDEIARAGRAGDRGHGGADRSSPPDVPVAVDDSASTLTVTRTVQVAKGGIEPFVSDTVPAAADALPPQLFDNPFGLLTTNPAGKLSLNATPVRVVATFGF